MSDNTTVERPNANARPRASSGETVALGCKMPNGVVLRNFVFDEVPEQMYGGGLRMTKIARQVGDSITLNGCAISVADVMSGRAVGSVVGGFGITTGIPKDFWDAWVEANKDTALVKNGIVFAANTEAAVGGMARERAEVRSGLEPMDPDNLPREFRRQRTAGGGITGVQRMTQGNDADNL